MSGTSINPATREAPVDPSHSASTSGDDRNIAEERKLWFDYLRSLNDRQAQSAQRSGFTNYVIIAVLIGLIYQFTPKLPLLVSTTAGTQATAVAAVLLVNTIGYSLAAYMHLVSYCRGERQNRLLPESRRRTNNVITWAFLSFSLLFTSLHFYVAVRFSFRSHFVQWLVAALGIWWGLNVLVTLTKQVRSVRLSVRYGTPAPRFSVQALQTGRGALIMGAVILPVAILSGVGAVIYLRTVEIDWLVPLGAASVFLVLMVICALLFGRGLETATQWTYDSLLQAIVVDKIDPGEIKSRFISATLGPDIAEWLNNLLTGANSATGDLARATEIAKRETRQIGGLPPEPQDERTMRAKKAYEDLSTALANHKQFFERILFQLKLFLEGPKSEREVDLLQKFKLDLDLSAKASGETVVAARSVLGELNRLAKGAE